MIVYARWLHRSKDSLNWCILSGTATPGTAEQHHEIRDRLNRDGKGRILWEWAESHPGDADYPRVAAMIEREAKRRGSTPARIAATLAMAKRKLEIVSTDAGRFAIVHTKKCNLFVPVAEVRK